MFCPKCGTKVEVNDTVCTNCGFPQPIEDAEDKTEYLNRQNGEDKTEFQNVNGETQTEYDLDKTVAAPGRIAQTPSDFDATVRSENVEASKKQSPKAINRQPVYPNSPVTPVPAAVKGTKTKKPLKINKKVLIYSIVSIVIVAALVAAGWITITYFMNQNAMQTGGLDYELTLGNKYLRDMDYEKALLSYENAIELDENSCEAHYGYARASAGLLDYEKAETSYKEAIKLNEMYADAYNGLAELYIQQDKKNDARELVDEAVNEKKINDPLLIEKHHGMNPVAPTTNVDPQDYNSDARYAVVLSDKYGGAVYYTHEYEGANYGYGYELTPKVYSQPIVLQNGRNVITAYVISPYGFTSDSATFIYNINKTDAPLTFVDSSIESAVKAALGKSYGPIYDDEVATITELSVVGTYYTDTNTTFTQTEYFTNNSTDGKSYEGNITNLSDLRYMPFLKTLNISFQQNLDFSTLVGCDYLENLSLINVKLTSVDRIASLKNLKKLCLGWNYITDISALGSLTELTHLGVWGNSISDISVVSKLTKLEYLDISDNRVSDISAVSGLSSLCEFWAYGNNISNFAPLVNLNKLTVLMVNGNPIRDTADLKKIYPRLKKVDIQIV